MCLGQARRHSEPTNSIGTNSVGMIMATRTFQMCFFVVALIMPMPNQRQRHANACRSRSSQRSWATNSGFCPNHAEKTNKGQDLCPCPWTRRQRRSWKRALANPAHAQETWRLAASTEWARRWDRRDRPRAPPPTSPQPPRQRCS